MTFNFVEYMNKFAAQITIDEIYDKEDMSVRSYHICKDNNFYYVSDLISFYHKNKSFDKLRSCGQKSSKELVNICNKFQIRNSTDNLKIEIGGEKVLLNIVEKLNRIQREVINSCIYVNTKSLSRRSNNAISLYLENNFKIKNFTDKILASNKFKVKKLKNIGAKCIPELEAYIATIKDFIIKVSETEDERSIIGWKNKFLIQRNFDVSLIPSEILESESIFLLTEFLIKKNAFFDEKQTIILRKTLKLYVNQKEITLDRIAKQVKFSRERVRQIRNLCTGKLFSKLLFLSVFYDDLYQKYGIDIESNCVEVTIDAWEKINLLNKTCFSKEFIIYILSVYLNDSFSLIGNYEDVLQFKRINSRNRHNWSNLYLVKKELASEINFTSLINDISRRMGDKIEESYSFNFKSYLSQFLVNDNIDILGVLFPIAEKIINDEFGLYLDLEENIIFKRNTVKQAYEYSYEALLELGKPSNVSDIYKKIIEINPNYITDEDKVRVSMKRKNGFVPIGRNSIFGLKKWETELDNFKGGSIRDIVKDYLIQFSIPKHIRDITEYVLAYRPKSSQRSILQNLKLDKSGLFVFFKDSKIGLSSKNYAPYFIRISEEERREKKTWNERFDDVQNFVSKEKRLPYSSGVLKKEVKLYRWLRIQKNKLKKGELDEIKTDKLNSIFAKYPKINATRGLNSEKKYKELMSFILLNNRLPLANKENEQNLYQFFYKQRKLYNVNKLEVKEQFNFIKVVKLIQEHIV